MRVLTDLHHFDLYYSLQLLFEERLGWELYRPIGMDWKTQGFWLIHGGKDEVAECYLSEVDGRCKELLSSYSNFKEIPWAVYALHLPRIGCIEPLEEGLFRVLDQSKDVWQYGITLEAFRNTKFDLLVASTPMQSVAFAELIKLYQPQAKLVLQMGNNWPIPFHVNNFMIPYPYPACHDKNSVVYHQEFNLSIFSFSSSFPSKCINAYVWFPESEELMNQVASCLPDFSFRFFGDTNKSLDQIILRSDTLAQTIKDSMFTWIIKPGGEGYGHILFNSFACGKPVIIRRADYINCSGDKLLIDGKTCIFLDDRSPLEIANLIKYYSQPEQYKKMCHAVYKQFIQTVDFDREFREIKLFLGRLL
jgi:glycosyltransferase involved in cell wall biosynthesis